MKQFLREFGCTLFGHEDDDHAHPFCIHCDERNPWIPPTKTEIWLLRVGEAFERFAGSMKPVNETLKSATDSLLAAFERKPS